VDKPQKLLNSGFILSFSPPPILITSLFIFVLIKILQDSLHPPVIKIWKYGNIKKHYFFQIGLAVRSS
jgi:hypothetical protein